MKAATRARRVVLTLIGVSMVSVAVITGVQAAQASPDYAISISPTSQSVQRGQTANYTVSVTSLNGFTSPVALSTSGGPTGTLLSAYSLTPSLGVPRTTTLSVPTPATGSYTITVSGVSGKIKHSATTGLTVNPLVTPPTASFTIATTPASLTVNAGSTGSYNIILGRTGGFIGTVSLALCSSLPDGVSFGGFSPPTLIGTASSATLTLNVDLGAKATSATLCIRGASGTLTSSTQGTLVIAKTNGKPFTISMGSLGLLAPGVSRPIDLTMTNNDKSNISVTNLTMSLTSTNKSTCPTSNFTIKQYTGSYPIPVAGNSATLLSTFISDDSLWPAITMTNTDSNQDECKGIRLSLSFSGSAQGN